MNISARFDAIKDKVINGRDAVSTKRWTYGLKSLVALGVIAGLVFSNGMLDMTWLVVLVSIPLSIYAFVTCAAFCAMTYVLFIVDENMERAGDAVNAASMVGNFAAEKIRKTTASS